MFSVLVQMFTFWISVITILTAASEIYSIEHSALSPFERSELDEYILCRSCGSDISASSYIVSKSSPQSLHSFNDTLFNENEVLIQILSNDIFEFPVVTFQHSSCVPSGEWENSESWFPGFQWKLCVCPDCGAYLGWVFEPINPFLVNTTKSHYGLILSNIIGESCNYNNYFYLWFKDGFLFVCFVMLISFGHTIF